MTSASPAEGGQRPPIPWYRDAVIYQLHVKSFQDGNDDGIGDFAGLLSRMDYIASLGVDALWLLPFFPSPRRDDGYDVADYVGVSTDYGTPEDVRQLLAAAHARGLRVLGDLVLNHTSDRHPWFERARRAPRDSDEHRFYVWSDSDQRYAGTRIIFPDEEKSNWTWDPVAGRYFFHRFYSHQPDLNYDNPRVLEEMLKVLRHWLDQGFDGFRLDAVAYLAEEEGTSNENLPATHAVLRRLRAELDAHYPQCVLLAEANQWPEDMKEYFGNDDECHMAFHFPLMPRMYMAVAQEDRFPVTDILAQTPTIPPNSQWAIFLRNHDELTLEMVTDAERDYLWETYAADPRARLNLGIRRRLAPLLQRDRRRIELMTALLLTLPGTPVIYYGDELGMGDNIHLGDRDGVRTPMQWSIDRNGGFSRADAHRLILPVLMDPLYGYPSINVEAQERDPHSLLHWVRGMIRMRRRYPNLFGAGAIRFLSPRNRKALAFLREDRNARVLCLANLARTVQAVELDLSEFDGRIPLEVLGGAALPQIASSPYVFTLPAYGFLALELVSRDFLPDWHAPNPESGLELPTLVLRHSLVRELQLGLFEKMKADALIPWLRREGWTRRYADPERLLLDSVDSLVAGDADSAALTLDDQTRRYAPMLLAVVWEGLADYETAKHHALARVRRAAKLGVLVEAIRAPSQLASWVRSWPQLAQGPANPSHSARLEAVPVMPRARSSGMELLVDRDDLQAAVTEGAMLVSIARGPAGALDAPLDVVRRLSRRRFPQSLPLIGEVRPGTDGSHAFAFAQIWRPTRGNAGQWTVDFLQRSFDDYRAASAERRAEILRGYQPMARLLGSRLARLHRALADEFGSAREGVERAPSNYRELVPKLLERLNGVRNKVHRELGVRASHLSGLARRLRALDKRLQDTPLPCLPRIHGDVSLGNIQLTADDAYFINFSLPSEELRSSDGSVSPLVDLAALIHGFSHAVATVRHVAGVAAEDYADFAQAFIETARRVALKRYRSTWEPEAAAGPKGSKYWLELLTLRQAIVGMESAQQWGALSVAYQALRP